MPCLLAWVTGVSIIVWILLYLDSWGGTKQFVIACTEIKRRKTHTYCKRTNKIPEQLNRLNILARDKHRALWCLKASSIAYILLKALDRYVTLNPVVIDVCSRE